MFMLLLWGGNKIEPSTKIKMKKAKATFDVRKCLSHSHLLYLSHLFSLSLSACASFFNSISPGLFFSILTLAIQNDDISWYLFRSIDNSISNKGQTGQQTTKLQHTWTTMAPPMPKSVGTYYSTCIWEYLQHHNGTVNGACFTKS